MNSKDMVYYALMNSSLDNEDISGFYALQDTDLSRVAFNKKVINNVEHWSHELYHSCRIDSSQDLTESFLANDKIYLQYPSKSFKLEQLKAIPGRYYARIYRPILKYHEDIFLWNPRSAIEQLRREITLTNEYLPINIEQGLQSVTQLSLLIESLKSICRVVQPASTNLGVFGSEIRNLLILSCTEVEAQLRGILLENTQEIKLKCSTSDYFKLCAPLKLKHYKIQYNLYPWLGYFCPFSEWHSDLPTQSLDWYDGYNAVKHNREQEFAKANLQFLFKAISAIAILLRAQYGPSIPYWNELIGQFFSFSETPVWKLDEQYFPPYKDNDWIPTKLEMT